MMKKDDGDDGAEAGDDLTDQVEYCLMPSS